MRRSMALACGSTHVSAVAVALWAGWFVAAIPGQASATQFTFAQQSAGKTSAGVFASDGTLIKTLWSGVSYTPGTYTGVWDDTDRRWAPCR